MQSLASYGSDGSDDDAPIPSSSSSKPPTAGPSTLSAVPAVVRIKTTTSAPHSRNHSPLAGVKPLPSSSSSTTNGQGRAGGPSPVKEGKRRESSASPPRYEVLRAPGAGRAEGAEGNNHGESREGSLPGFVGCVQIDSLAAFGVPPLSTGPCNPSVEAKLANFHHLAKTRGLHFNDSLSASKAFRNPRIYAKLVEFVKVDETGSNWDKRVWDPKGLHRDSDAERIAELQRVRSEAKAAIPAGSRSSIAFSSSSTSRSDEQARIRDAMSRKSESSSHQKDHGRDKDKDKDGKRSRWDNAGEKRRERSRSRSPRRR